MASIILRGVKGSALSNNEVDQNFTNLNNELITKLATSSYTASDVLTKLTTVDGVGSGLDADLLDGLNTSSSLPVATNKSSIVSRDSSGNFSANTITATVTNANNLTGVATNGFISKIGIDSNIARIITGIGNDITVANGDGVSGNPVITAGSNIPKINASNNYTLLQNFALVVANGLSNDANNNLFTGLNSLSPTSTDGFVYVPMITGIPTGNPTANTGRSPIVWDATSNKMWVYSGGQWNSIATVQKFNSSKILPFNASQGGNILTGTFAPAILDYRDANLVNGIPNEFTNTTLTVSIPAASSLGLTSGINSPLLWLVAYNSGSPVLCVTNLLGNGNLDETGLISPTTISSASTSSNVIYSNSVVAPNSPYRIVGITYGVYTTGTGWSSPTLVQGVGGRALDVLSRIGAVRSWQNSTSTVLNGVTYINTSPFEILLKLFISNAYPNAATCFFVIDSVQQPSDLQESPNSGFGTRQTSYLTVVPAGKSYRFTASGNYAVWTYK